MPAGASFKSTATTSSLSSDRIFSVVSPVVYFVPAPGLCSQFVDQFTLLDFRKRGFKFGIWKLVLRNFEDFSRNLVQCNRFLSLANGFGETNTDL